jgi:hypothetical protein
MTIDEATAALAAHLGEPDVFGVRHDGRTIIVGRGPHLPRRRRVRARRVLAGFPRLDRAAQLLVAPFAGGVIMGVGRGYSGGPGVGVHRVGVSGPWLDSHGNPARSPNADYGASSSPPPPAPAQAPKLPNPDPYNYSVLEAEQVGQYLVLKVKYPDCTNFEGTKVMVYRGVTPLDLLKQKFLDPHFFESKKVAAPVARFVPTAEGWTMALRFARMMETRP